ncbi:MAG: Type I restriction-modification system, restriction subunit R (EC [uncultured Sulfurovum sp.]|uniref:Type I restriction-modification system, restriction subunit R (EC) n=1 Tax=uncultured Sulfurovum sp. TaxID=269237 RepID=A0A6S6SIA0_9BACT|nr:MAG: Type I restriction-modification system, restriction subunit R (EC [uncultured Sulfurovum sp.]
MGKSYSDKVEDSNRLKSVLGKKKSNFEFLLKYDPIFFQLASVAEEMYHSDPNTTLVKLRQLAEALGKDIALKMGIASYEYKDQYELIYLLEDKLSFSYKVRNLFHMLRKEGNRAVHEFTTNHHQALKALKNAYKLSIWYHGTFGDVRDFKVKAFVVPKDPTEKLQKIHNDYEALKAKLLDHKEKLEESKALAELKEQEHQEYDKLIEEMKRMQGEEKALMLEQEATFEEQTILFEQKINKLSCSISDEERKKLEKIYQHRGEEVLCYLSLDEDKTYEMVDLKLNERGWKADSTTLDYEKGTRPIVGENRAIRNWECIDSKSGEKSIADYVLFIGLKPVAIVEVTMFGMDVIEGIEEAQERSCTINLTSIVKIAEQEDKALVLDEWYADALEEKTYRVPMVFSSNGREYQHQEKTKSGIWFRDLRRIENNARVLVHWFSPDEIAEFLDRNDENIVSTKEENILNFDTLKRMLFS